MKLKLIQERVKDALDALEALARADCPVVVEDRGDVAAALAEALGRTALVALVQTPGFAVSSTASKIMVGTASVAVQFIERVLENRDRAGSATAQDCAECAAWALNMLPVEGVGVLAVRRLASAAVDAHAVAWTVELDVQTTLADPSTIDN